MMHRWKKLFACVLASCLLSSLAFASDPVPAKREEAVAMVKRSQDFIRQYGKQKALAEFNKPVSDFVDRELYVIVLDLNGIVLAHGANQKLVGKDLKDIRDVDGKYFVREQIALAKGAGKGWIDFHWMNPVSQKMAPRSVYLERVDDYLVASGIFTSK